MSYRKKMSSLSLHHTFHIPVMGLAYTAMSPIAVAKYGISSVIPATQDQVLEYLREHYLKQLGEEFVPIEKDFLTDYRANRIESYLNLVDRIVKKDTEELRASPFENGSEITKYFELIPECATKELYRKMLNTTDANEKEAIQNDLRKEVESGSIDVNIMTKVDGIKYHQGKALPREFSDACAAARGFAKSTVDGGFVLSAGMNPSLYGYMATLDQFYPDKNGYFKKKIILKVTDYRSAYIQGKFLAKKGLWVSEFRIESAVNCGGHAFLNDGYLIGPILEEFKEKRKELVNNLRDICYTSLKTQGKNDVMLPDDIAITAQGGVGTKEEHEFLLNYYKVDSVGWCTPFLLVPEVTMIDDETLNLLAKSQGKDVELSTSSPIGIPFWKLLGTSSEKFREKRIAEGSPGNECIYRHLALNTEFSEIPMCAASKAYYKLKKEALEKSGLASEKLNRAKEILLSKVCLCSDLMASAQRLLKIDENAPVTVCPGPNIVYFTKRASLTEMIDHIYGRISLLSDTINRPHMFVNELKIHVDNLKQELRDSMNGIIDRPKEKFIEIKNNLEDGLKYYIWLSKEFSEDNREAFLAQIESIAKEIREMKFDDEPLVTAL